MSSKAEPNHFGFTLIEAIVAILMSVAIVVGIGTVSGRLIHHRTTTSSNSAATSLAERTMESLLSVPDPANDASLTSGTHGPCGTPPCTVDFGGTATANGPYTLQWSVGDSGTASTFFVTPTAQVKRITVTVAHANNPMVASSVVAFYNVR